MSKTRIDSAGAALLVLLALTVGATAAEPAPAAPPSSAPGQPPVLAFNWTSKAELPVKPLDDPANPYRGQYGDVDQWAWRHAQPPESVLHPDANPAGPGQTEPETQQLDQPWPVRFLMVVDEHGWQIPFVQFQAQARSLPDRYDPTYGATTPHEYFDRSLHRKPLPHASPSDALPQYYYVVEGAMPPAVYFQFEAEFFGRNADEYPAVPAWLGENPPVATVFLPDGTLLCYGRLGAHYLPSADDVPEMDMYGPLGLAWYHYTAEGQLLETRQSQSEPGSWLASWNTGLLDQLATANPRPLHIVRGQGYLVVGQTDNYDGPHTPGQPPPASQPAQAKAAYNWDGSALPLDGPLPHYPPGTGQLVDRSGVARTYRTQLRRGRTSAASVSPYAGQPDGPQVTDPAPQPHPRVAMAYGGGYPQRYVLLRPLDDPANPYRGQYMPWDEWVYAHAGEQNPARLAFNREQSRQLTEQANLARAAGQESKPLRDLAAYVEPTGSKWRRIEGEYDAQGWLIPATQSWDKRPAHRELNDNRSAAPTEPPLYGRTSEAEMEPAEYQAYLEALAAAGAERGH